MGCSNNKSPQMTKVEGTSRFFKEIEEKNEKNLKELAIIAGSDVDELLIEISHVYFNPLGYAIVSGSSKCFKFLHKMLGASLEKMETLLIAQRIYPLHLISQCGSLEIFKYYVRKTKLNFNIKGPEFSLSGYENFKDKLYNHHSYNSIQLICEYGYVHLLSFVLSYRQSFHIVPHEFDIEYVDDYNGENCALIASRKGNYVLIKFLQDAGADFNKKNLKGENALQILCSANRNRSIKEFYECFYLLLNPEFVDFTYNFEETLLLIEDEMIINKFEAKLKEVGIFTSKKDVEKSYLNKTNAKKGHHDWNSEVKVLSLSITGKDETGSNMTSHL
jgi:hypothetical protein